MTFSICGHFYEYLFLKEAELKTIHTQIHAILYIQATMRSWKFMTTLPLTLPLACHPSSNAVFFSMKFTTTLNKIIIYCFCFRSRKEKYLLLVANYTY